MSLLEKLTSLITQLEIPVETGVFSCSAPNQYIVLVPLVSRYELYSDNLPQRDIDEVRVSVFSKSNYSSLKKELEKIFIENSLTITDRRYIGYEKETEYHHYIIDVAEDYDIKEE